MKHAGNGVNPYRFFGWVLLLSAPFYVWGVFWPVRGLPYGLPATAIMIVVPASVATFMTHREQGAAAAWQLWRRIGDLSRIRGVWWLSMALLIMPAASLFAYPIMREFDLPLPSAVSISLIQAAPAFAVYFAGAIFEEIGWTGYATAPLQRRYGILGAGLIIGTVWALWHVVPWWFGQGHPLSWVAGQFISTVFMRIVMGWIYAYGGQSLFLAIVFHATINTSYSMFPNGGSHYDPSILAAVLAIITAIIAFVHPIMRRTSIFEAGHGPRNMQG